jgi:cytochrome c556
MNSRSTSFLAPILGLAVLAAAAGSAVAQQAVKPETLIKSRQSAFQLVAYHSSRIKANLDGQYNKDEVARAANTIAAIANSGLGSLFAAGTETGKGWHDTGARPELFKDLKKFAEYGGNFSRESTELAKVALNGDAATVKEQYGKLTRTCKACHDDFKTKD